jgi:hypothetical protein
VTNEQQISLLKEILKRFQKLERTVSIIIQGRLNERSISKIPEYLKQGEVVVSCWENDNLRLLDKYKDKIKTVINTYPNPVIYQHLAQAPWIYQHHSTSNGLREATSHFSIKVRSDEAYPVLAPLIDKLIKQNEERDPITGEFENRIITSNIYFRKDKEAQFHPSDHLVAGTTSRMRDCFNRARFLCSLKESKAIKFPEQLLCQSIIESKWNNKRGSFCVLDPSNSIKIMEKHLDIIRIKDLPAHIWTSSYRKYRPLVNEEDWCNSIEEL